MLPTAIQKILLRMEQAGWQIYLVGGCVRDRLLGRPIHDWDLTTNARPEQVMQLFPKVIPTGIAHGTVTVVQDEMQAEITTFRTETGYADGRHPDEVRFVGSLEEDLARRDFTINAMAMDASGKLYDFYGGQEDLRRGVLRCVGQPQRRFAEDALRMFRAYRFSAQLGFALERETENAAKSLHERARFLSVERIREELEKTICSPHPQMVEQMAKIGLLERFGVTQADASRLQTVAPQPLLRWGVLMACVPALRTAELRLDRHTKQVACRTAELDALPCNRLMLKRLLAYEMPDVAVCFAALHQAEPMLQEILRSGECVSLHDLAVSGKDLTQSHGREVGQELHELLELVLQEPEKNHRDLLLQIYKDKHRE